MEIPGQLPIISLTVIEGNLLRDSELISSMDPYLVIEYNKLKFKTKVLDKADKHPVWNEIFKL